MTRSGPAGLLAERRGSSKERDGHHEHDDAEDRLRVELPSSLGTRSTGF